MQYPSLFSSAKSMIEKFVCFNWCLGAPIQSRIIPMASPSASSFLSSPSLVEGGVRLKKYVGDMSLNLFRTE